MPKRPLVKPPKSDPSVVKSLQAWCAYHEKLAFACRVVLDVVTDRRHKNGERALLRALQLDAARRARAERRLKKRATKKPAVTPLPVHRVN